MKILVCISNVPDTTSKINFKDNNTAFDTASKRIEMLEEKLIKAQNDIEALTPVKAVKASK